MIDSKETINNVLVHDNNNRNLARLLADITYHSNLPVPIGGIYEEIKQKVTETKNIELVLLAKKTYYSNLIATLFVGNKGVLSILL